jgi:hypothetical protein
VSLIWLLVIFGFFLFLVFAGAARKARLSPRSESADLVEALLGLEADRLDELFDLYRQQYGRGAARYARRTFRKWRTRRVSPSRQTFERLLLQLPKVMSFDLKCEVLRTLRRAYCARDAYELTVYTDDWQDALEPLVADLVERAYTARLPERVERRLAWLAENEMQVAGALLAESQAREGRSAVALLAREMSEMERLLTESGGARVKHTLILPCGTITLHVKKR